MLLIWELQWICQVRWPDGNYFRIYINNILFRIDQQIGTLLWRDIQYAFFDFINNILADCNENPSQGKIPLRINDPIYGDKIPNFTDFAAPGVILT